MKLKRAWKGIAAALGVGMLVSAMGACGAGGAGGSKTTLTFLSWNNEQVMRPYIDQFEQQNPGIKVDFSYSPPTPEYIQTLQTRLVGNQAPDVFIITSENKADLIKNGYVRDLTNEPFMRNISQANKDFVSHEGKVYGMSVSSWASGIVYNKDLLAKAGAKEVPETWDGFLQLCKKLKAAGVTPFLETIADGPSRIPDAFMGSQFDRDKVDVTSLIDRRPQKPGSDQREAAAAWMKLYDQGLVTRDTVGISGDDMKTQFINGQVAMICTGPWDLPSIGQAGLKYGMAPMPLMEKGMVNYAQGSPSPAYAIYSHLKGDKLKAARKFLTFMDSHWALQRSADNGDAITVQGFKAKVKPEYEQVYRANVQPGHYFLLMNFYAKPDVLTTVRQSETQQLVQGSINLDQWAKAIDDKMASVK
ncbi:extracellular solute-binding protein [Bifidobacterium sp. W8113]|uniref:ABC transporter substrate-binding protein n=1 Tax=Bifidobacterium choladohabitans TaxID=2750947 RepID=UPI0018DCB897|nr:extracellular solute-binding protein [Bifidobacterium choladohabitans]MBI0089882.1 extracellular solute-binding protein [Bifidobacterium choladohabitans]